MCNIRQRLVGRLHMIDIVEISLCAEKGEGLRRELFDLLYDDNMHVANNAAWVMTHFSSSTAKCLSQYQNQLVDTAMNTSSSTRRRLMLTSLNRQDFATENVRVDFLDFCLENMTLETVPSGIRALCVKLAYKQCNAFPELVEELKNALEMLDDNVLPPGMKSAKKQVLAQCKFHN